jgi:hypothetical protein
MAAAGDTASVGLDDAYRSPPSGVSEASGLVRRKTVFAGEADGVDAQPAIPTVNATKINDDLGR